MSELDVRKDFICTTTENTNQYGSRRIADTNYSSNLSKEFVSKLSVKNTASNLTIYIGEPKLNIASTLQTSLTSMTGMWILFI
jgi:hypothetical protein